MKVHRYDKMTEDVFDQKDMIYCGLIGEKDSSIRRNAIGKILGIGYTNGKQFLNRLNGYGIKREDFIKALEEVERNER